MGWNLPWIAVMELSGGYRKKFFEKYFTMVCWGAIAGPTTAGVHQKASGLQATRPEK